MMPECELFSANPTEALTSTVVSRNTATARPASNITKLTSIFPTDIIATISKVQQKENNNNINGISITTIIVIISCSVIFAITITMAICWFRRKRVNQKKHVKERKLDLTTFLIQYIKLILITQIMTKIFLIKLKKQPMSINK